MSADQKAKPPKDETPTYRPVQMPTGDSLLACSGCGAAVLDQNTHNTWHEKLDPKATP